MSKNEVTLLKLPQNQRVPVQTKQCASYGYRYAFSPSAESLANGDKGQDALVIREDGRKLVFTLCDGVSQSFFGDLAASFLAENMTDHLWDTPCVDYKSFQKNIRVLLNELPDEAASLVSSCPLPIDVSPLVRDVLEQKREHGSETTFVTGYFDIDQQRLFLAWMGDSRLRIWGRQGEITSRLGNTFHSNERWSTRNGCIGSLHTIEIAWKDFYYLVAYSDGLSLLDRSLKWHMRNDDIDDAINDALQRPESDDISFFEVWVGPEAPPEQFILPAPQEIRQELLEEYLILHWQPVTGATTYEIRFDNKRMFKCDATCSSLKIPIRDLQGVTSGSIRALNQVPGHWSEPFKLELLLDTTVDKQPLDSANTQSSFRQLPSVSDRTAIPARLPILWYQNLLLLGVVAVIAVVVTLFFLIDFLRTGQPPTSTANLLETEAVSQTSAVSSKPPASTPEPTHTATPEPTHTATPELRVTPTPDMTMMPDTNQPGSKKYFCRPVYPEC